MEGSAAKENTGRKIFFGFKFIQIITKIIYKVLKTFHNNSKTLVYKN